MLTVLGCAGEVVEPLPTPPVDGAVTVADNEYQPATVTIDVNGTVTWTWAGSAFHNVTFDDAVGSSGNPKTSGTHTRTFAAAGSFTYFCEVHGRAVMAGTVTVQ